MSKAIKATMEVKGTAVTVLTQKEDDYIFHNSYFNIHPLKVKENANELC